MGGGAWQVTVHGVTKSWTRLSDFTFTFSFNIGPLTKSAVISCSPAAAHGGVLLQDPALDM